MIIYDLCCENDHRFEGWFKSSDDFQTQLQQGLLTCPACSSVHVARLPSASYVHTRSQTKTMGSSSTTQASPDNAEPPTRELLDKLQDYLDKHSENVGSQFAEEAKKIHYGETPQRHIHGQASADELSELDEEGVAVTPLPVLSASKKKFH